MLNIVLCDDDAKFCSKVQRLLKERIEYDKNISVFNKYDAKLAEYIEKNKDYTVFILDINLKNEETDGYSIAKKIRKLRNYNDEIIFLTNHKSMSPGIIKHKIQPIDFITKSDYFINDLLTAIEEGKERISAREVETDTGVLIIHENRAMYKIPYKYIICMELLADSRSVLIRMNPSYMKSEFCHISSINSVMRKLDERFFQISRTAVVNKDYIEFVDPNDKKVGMRYGHVLEGSEEKIKELVRWLK